MADTFPDIATADGRTFQLLIDNHWRPAASGETTEARSPISDELVGRLASATVEDANAAVASAARAWPEWNRRTFTERAELLHTVGALMREHLDLLTDLLVVEIAKPRGEAVASVERTACLMDYFAEEGRRFYGEIIFGDSFPGYSRNKVCQVYRDPQGVILAISPFNYPLNLSGSKIAPALITGNSVVFKPATNGAIVALHMAELFRRAGLPPGVLNVITGRASVIGDALVAHPQVDMIAFTGSTDVGHHIALTAGMIPLMMELGGKDAAIVLADADLELAAREIVKGAFSYAGQRCTAVKRVLVVPQVADELVERVAAGSQGYAVGDPRDPKVKMGPVIDDGAADLVQGLIDDALARGARLVCGNERHGRYLAPTILDQVTEDMRLAWEEPFGPVLPIIRVADALQAADISNKSSYGLQSCVFTQDLDYAFWLGRQLEVGTVNINGADSRGPDHFPFVGRKDSGMEAQGVHYSISAMTKTKAITFNLRPPSP
jgi:glyceraldehyde-3-phosphate dehydrogenase (NADP+)